MELTYIRNGVLALVYIGVVWWFLEKLERSCPDMPLLSIQQGNEHTYTKTCTQMLIAALFKSVKKWEQPKRLSKFKWINRTWHIVGYYPATKCKEALIYM